MYEACAIYTEIQVSKKVCQSGQESSLLLGTGLEQDTLHQDGVLKPREWV